MAHVVRMETRYPFGESDSFGPYAINTWFASYDPLIGPPDTPGYVADQMRSGILDFFGYDDPDTGRLSSYMSSALVGSIEFRYWDLDGWAGIGSPYPHDAIFLADGSMAGSVAGDSLPTQVAVCLSSKCDPYGGHKRQSFYNRQYIGPLSSATVNTGGRVIEDFRLRLLSGANQFAAAFDIIGTDVAHPCVFSAKHNSSGLTTSAFVDDRFDIQRRRALEPHARSTAP